MSDLEKYFTPFAIQAMEENEITLKLLASRLIVSEDLEKAFSFNQRGRKSKYPKWAHEIAKENGISRQTLYHRVNIQGMSIEQAIKVIPIKTQKETIERMEQMAKGANA